MNTNPPSPPPQPPQLEWEVGFHPSNGGPPETWIPACLPGAVQLDWARAQGWGPYWKGNAFLDYRWMEDCAWTYRCRLPAVECPAGSEPFFHCGGVDYQFDIHIDGLLLESRKGMFAPVDLCLTGLLHPGAELTVRIHPAPKRQVTVDDRSQADHCFKPAVSYGWDWHPRLVPLGIWKDAGLRIRPRDRFLDVRTHADFAGGYTVAHLGLTAEIAGRAGASVLIHLRDGSGTLVHESSRAVTTGAALQASITVEQPRLWWPHDQGEPHRYRLQLILHDSEGTELDRWEGRPGLRRTRLVMNEGTWDEPSGFPKSRSAAPITLEINGREIFAKGSNWVNPEIFPGLIDADTCRPLLELAKEANFNLLRVWGGGIVNKDSFYELCDELGLMVWTEFPLACNAYPDDDHYLEVLDRESRAIIEAVRPHPCNVIWCGGNELFNAWSRMTDQSLPLRRLNANCLELDPKTPFLPTSPLEGMGHGHYLFHDPKTGLDAFQLMNSARATAYTEFGVPGPSSIAVLRSFMDEAELFPPRTGTSWETHHGLGAWSILEGTWLCPSIIARYFGEPASLEELVRWGQLLQSEGYKAIYEEARRQKPHCSMALNWCFNEPWPSAANNSLINWPAVPKPAFFAVRASCRPVLASARFRRFDYRRGDLLEIELWLLNDSPEPVALDGVEVGIEIDGQTQEILRWEAPAAPANRNREGPVARYRLGEYRSPTLRVRLHSPGHPETNSDYTLCYHPSPIGTGEPADHTRELNQ